MSVTEKEFTLKKAWAILCKNGVDWSFGWFKTQVILGKIQSRKVFNSRVVNIETLNSVIHEFKNKERDA